MRANRRRDTGPERRIRKRLHGLGLRFRVDFPIRSATGRLVRPDIVFTRARIAVFVDGCFWHGCPDHGRRPNIQNQSYWGPKIAANMRRDTAHTNALRAAGWTVLRFWEHDTPQAAALAILEAYGAAVKPSGRRATDPNLLSAHRGGVP